MQYTIGHRKPETSLHFGHSQHFLLGIHAFFPVIPDIINRESILLVSGGFRLTTDGNDDDQRQHLPPPKGSIGLSQPA